MKRLLILAPLLAACNTDALIDQAEDAARLCAQVAVIGIDVRPIIEAEDILRREALLVCANKAREEAGLPPIHREMVGLPPLA